MKQLSHTMHYLAKTEKDFANDSELSFSSSLALQKSKTQTLKNSNDKESAEIVVKSKSSVFHEQAVRELKEEYPCHLHFGWRIDSQLLGTQREKNNNIRTARYTKSNWVPASLMYQMKKLANIYFIVITLLAFVPGSPKSPFFSILTIAIMLTFLVIKDGREDRSRRENDDAANLTLANDYSYSSIGFTKKA